MTIEKHKKMNKGEVTLIERVANEMFLIKIKVAADFESKPGQFVSILCDNHTMRRPFSIMNFEDGEISVLFKKKGDGTAYIASLNVGDTVDFIGPNGNGFHCIDEKTLLVGAGVGVAPVFYLKKVLGDKARLIAGFQNENEIPSCLLHEIDFISTDDGSAGAKGSIIAYLDAQIEEFKPERICTCGPHIVLKLVAETAKKHGIPCEVAMEKTMACSIGVCRGCVVTLNRNGKIDNASVCKDGPVFLGEEIVW
ncbi:MAG: dihydroorotate dehydrogenase electron transfer subunit [Fusobacterium sp.]|nr:dihydroorotate dehydrogenase electron transfer subunit [Fusobacterium sp.]